MHHVSIYQIRQKERAKLNGETPEKPRRQYRKTKVQKSETPKVSLSNLSVQDFELLRDVSNKFGGLDNLETIISTLKSI